MDLTVVALKRPLACTERALWLALCCLPGCAVGPEHRTPVAPVAQQWRPAEDPRIDTATKPPDVWWSAFDDPALSRLVALAHEQNLPLQVAGLRIVEARAQLAVARGRLFPQIQFVSGSVSAERVSANAPNASELDRDFFDFQVGFDAAWEADIWGKYRRGIEAERAGVLASVGDYQYAIVTLASEVARTYTTLRTLQVLIALARTNAAIQQDSLEIAESRFRNGATSELDVAQAKTQVESTKASIPQLESDLLQARNALGTLLGITTTAVAPLLSGPEEIPTAPSAVAVGLPAELLRRRPDVRAAELRAASQSARVGVAEAELYPAFTLFGSIGFEASTAERADFGPEDSLFYSAGARVLWPFFDYGRLRNAVRIEDAQYEQLLVEYRDSVLRAAQEVEDALAGYLNNRDAMEFRDAAVGAAKRAVELALIQYREGAVDFQRVLDAERELLQQQNNFAQTRSSVTTSAIALYKALGGGWEGSEGHAVVPAAIQSEMEERTGWGDLLSEPPESEAEQGTTPQGH